MRHPEKEADRLEQSSKAFNVLVIIGGGALYHVPMYRSQRLIILIIPDRELFLMTRDRAINTSVEDRDDIILLLKKAGETNSAFVARVSQEFSNRYQPLFHGKLFIYSHRSLEDLYKECFADISTSIHDCAERALSDFLTQKHFGALWLNQICKNTWLSRSALRSDSTSSNRSRWEKIRTQWQGRPVIILGAGPSLEEGIEKIRDRRKNTLLIASDTAMPCLLKNSIHPHWVLTLDPQYYSLLHYLTERSSETILFHDIGIHPAIPRLFNTASSISLASRHPLAQWLLKHQADIVTPPLYGTNAGSAILGLALAVHPSRIESYGIDFLSTRGNRYCRGSYQHRWSHIHNNRLATAELYHYTLATLEARANIVYRNGNVHYTGQKDEQYRLEFESLAHSHGKTSKNGSYTIIPANETFMKPEQDNKQLIADPWKTFAQILSETGAADFSRFAERFFSAHSTKLEEKDTVLFALMPFFASHSDKKGRFTESAFLKAIELARKKISHIMIL